MEYKYRHLSALAEYRNEYHNLLKLHPVPTPFHRKRLSYFVDGRSSDLLLLFGPFPSTDSGYLPNNFLSDCSLQQRELFWNYTRFPIILLSRTINDSNLSQTFEFRAI